MKKVKKSPKIQDYFKFKGSINIYAFLEILKDLPGVDFQDPHPGQEAFLQAYEERMAPDEEATELGLSFLYKYNVFVVAAGRRWGKSTICSVVGAQELMVPNSKVMIVSYTLDNCSIIFKKIYDIIKALGIKMVVERYRDMELELENGSSIKIASNDNVESKLGDSVTLLILDEARLFNRTLLEQVLLPMTFDAAPYSRICLISSPAPGWLETYYQRGISDEPKWAKYFGINSPTHTNPTIPRNVLEEMKESLPDLLYRQEVLGEFVSSEGHVYSEFDKNTCVFTDDDFPDWQRYLQNGYVTVNSIDSGFAHYFGSVWFVDVEELDTIFIFDEYFKNRTVTPVHAENIHRIEEDYGVEVYMRYADPAAAQQIADLAEYGLYYNKSEKNLRETINSVNTLFMQKSEVTDRPKLQIHSKCKELIRELSFLTWKKGQDDLSREQSAAGMKPFEKDGEGKTDWDLQDAMRYGIYSYVKNSRIGMNSLDNLTEQQDYDDFDYTMGMAGWVKL